MSREGLDLNFPPPEDNMDLSGSFAGSNAPEMQTQVHGQFQPQHVNNVQVIDDEISIISPTVFSEARKKRLRNSQGLQIMNENMGFHPVCGPMGHEYVEVQCSYGQMQLPGEWTNVPISFADPSVVCAHLRVTRTIQANVEKDVAVSPKEEEQPMAASLSCPICISPMAESTTTRCGHVFCKACIEAAIKAQHKCPTCRRKLKKNDTIRIYLPTSV